MIDSFFTDESENLQVSAVLAQLTIEQIRFVVARQRYATDKEAAEAIGLKPDTVYRWPEAVREAARALAMEGIATARELRRRYLAQAMLVKVDGLVSADEKIRQAAATEIIEWEMGKATQRQEHAGVGGKPIEIIEVAS